MQITKEVDVFSAVEVSVEIDADDIVAELDKLDDVALESRYNLQRIPAGTDSIVDRWRAIARAWRNGNQVELGNLLSAMAWEQASVTIPVVGLRSVG